MSFLDIQIHITMKTEWLPKILTLPINRECKRIKTAWKKTVFIAGFYWFFSKKFWKKPTKVVFFKILPRKRLRMWPKSRISLRAVIYSFLKTLQNIQSNIFCLQVCNFLYLQNLWIINWYYLQLLVFSKLHKS